MLTFEQKQAIIESFSELTKRNFFKAPKLSLHGQSLRKDDCS